MCIISSRLLSGKQGDQGADCFHGARPRLITATDAENGRIHFPFLNYKNKSESMTSFSLNKSHWKKNFFVLMAFQNKDELLCSNSCNVMGKEKNECGTVQMFVSTRNVIGFCPVCSSFVVTVTGHSLCGQHTRPRRRRHHLINDSIRHPSGHSSTQSTRRFEMEVQFIALARRERRF